MDGGKAFIAALIAIPLAVVCLPSVFSTPSGGKASQNGADSKKEVVVDAGSKSAKTTTQPYNGYDYNFKKTTPSYADSRWPTKNSQLLAIPEDQRWYNAWYSAESFCTIAGPVVNVYQAKDSNGMPIFIDIGTAYPSDDSVSLVVWADQYDDFAQMINEVDDGGAWISVTGYLSVYNGQLQFNAHDGYIEYTWWTHVS